MTARTARLWTVLAALGVVVAATVSGANLAELAAGLLLIASGLALIALDGQRKRRRTRR